MAIDGRNDTVTKVQNLDEAVCISHSANTFQKGIYLTILLPAIDEESARLGSLT